MRVAFWGAGKMAHEFMKEYQYKKDMYKDFIIGFFDNNKNLWGKETEFGVIKSPMELKEIEIDIMVIVCDYYHEIKSDLISNYCIEERKIFSIDEYKRKCNALMKYEDRYKGKCINLNKFDDKIIVYTAITGGYDFLNEPLYTNNNITYVCFTNNRNLKSDVWNIEYIKDNRLNDMYMAKKIKLMPNEYCKGYETSVWVDGKYLIKGDLRSYISKFQKQMPMICFPHPVRSCIYDEAAVCICEKRGKKEEIIPQITHYYREGFPYDRGLYEMGCIVRQHNDARVIQLMRDWWTEISKYSHRDQISFPYVCLKNDFEPDICNLDINHNEWLEMVRGKM